jgi:hypothetical protein
MRSTARQGETARLRQCLRQPLRQPAEAMRLIDQTQERLPGRVGAESLRRLPEPVDDHRADQVGRVSGRPGWQRDQQELAAARICSKSGASSWQSTFRRPRRPRKARSLFDSGANACSRRPSESARQCRQNCIASTSASIGCGWCGSRSASSVASAERRCPPNADPRSDRTAAGRSRPAPRRARPHRRAGRRAG